MGWWMLRIMCSGVRTLVGLVALRLATTLGAPVLAVALRPNWILSAGSVFEWELGSLSTSGPGVNFDQVVVGGNLVLGGTSSLNLDFTLPSLAAADPNAGDPFWNSPHSWKIIDTNTNTGGTNFSSITNGTWSFGHFTTTVVPAPTRATFS